MTALPSGYKLQEFEIVRKIGQGGFGLTYEGWDHSLNKRIAIKEYFPSDWVRRDPDGSVSVKGEEFADFFNWGANSFVEEARTMALFDHPNVVRVFRHFPANATAYIIMEFVEGEDLKGVLGQRGTLSAQEVRRILSALLDGLTQAHRAGVLHRDIKPDNIRIRAGRNEPVLIDFGAARQLIQQHTKPITAIVSKHFAPNEQYSDIADNQGPWTDLYSISAVGYLALCGRLPPEAPSRAERDAFIPLDERAYDDPDLCRAINEGLRFFTFDRPQDIDEWLAIADGAPIPYEDGPLPASVITDTRLRPASARPDAAPRRSATLSRSPASASQPVEHRAPGSRLSPRFVMLSAFGAVVAIGLAGAALLRSTEPERQIEVDTDASELTPRESLDDVLARAASVPESKPCPDCPEIVTIPAGQILVGADPGSRFYEGTDGPTHEVTISRPFEMSKTEVTVGQFMACVRDGACSLQMDAVTGLSRVDPKEVDLPMHSLTVRDIDAYLGWLSNLSGTRFRLPSEYEWEYAARAGARTAFAWGEAPQFGRARCLDCSANGGQPALGPVAEFSPNAFGLYDVHGSVWELVADCWQDSHVGAPDNGTARGAGECGVRVTRGGGWNSPIERTRLSMRLRFQSLVLADNGSYEPTLSSELGFRVVRDLP